ncbi:hypothetical protein [Synechococcus sp. H55.10]|uniref:hypothetical protein n=1 Tax=Synechococcus sp. H55.10 TaxID=2964503 RepID=UPI0039C723AD
MFWVLLSGSLKRSAPPQATTPDSSPSPHPRSLSLRDDPHPHPLSLGDDPHPRPLSLGERGVGFSHSL